jgi:anhydro-N-acetylmuramic acid kinase
MFNMQNSYQVIGVMSGTSLDGIDIVYTHITKESEKCWHFEVIHAETFPFSKQWEDTLRNAHELPASKLHEIHIELGFYLGQIVNNFIQKYAISKSDIDFISSHGQTIFHQPNRKITLQIGSGISFSLACNLKVITDFRQKDVCLGGQGAPLVPIGDQLLFKNKADSFLNIGGFANISFEKEGKIHAFDISPGNLVLNKLMNTIGENFDRGGELAKSGEINFYLLEMLNNLEYYAQSSPKSLGIEWLEKEFYPLIKLDKDLASNLRTIVEHEAFQIAKVLNENELQSVFVTGGGAYNSFLIERIKNYFSGEIIIPENIIIDFKEAIVFAFLGALHVENQVNCLSSVTGASRDSVGGVTYLP